MGTYNCKIRQFLRFRQIRFHPALFQQVHTKRHILGKSNSIGAICIIEHRHTDPIMLVDIDFFLILLTVMDSQHSYFRIIIFPEVLTIHQPLLPFIKGMVGGMENHIKSGIYQSIPQFKGSVEAGISCDSQLLSSQNHLLVHQGQIRLLHNRRHIFKQSIKIIASVL